MDGWMNQLTDGQTNRQTADRKTDRQVHVVGTITRGTLRKVRKFIKSHR